MFLYSCRDLYFLIEEKDNTMINSINALTANYEINKYKNNYNFYNSFELINKEAEGDGEQDQGSTLSDADQATISTTKALIDYLKSGLSSKFEQISKKVASKKSGSSSSSTTGSTTPPGTTPPGTTTTPGETEENPQPTEQQLKVKAQTQTLIQKLLSDTTIAKRYNNFMSKYYGVGTSTSGSTTSSGSTTTSGSSTSSGTTSTTTTGGSTSTTVPQQVASFVSQQMSLLSSSKFSGFLSNNSSFATNDNSSVFAIPTNSETTGTNKLGLVNKIKV